MKNKEQEAARDFLMFERVMTEEEIEKAIKEAIDKMKGLISEEAALMIVAVKNGYKPKPIKENKFKIKNNLKETAGIIGELSVSEAKFGYKLSIKLEIPRKKGGLRIEWFGYFANTKEELPQCEEGDAIRIKYAVKGKWKNIKKLWMLEDENEISDYINDETISLNEPEGPKEMVDNQDRPIGRLKFD
ncbi:MAG: hypothetical protein ACTSU2_02410 [Promethearchaeota archaeon]